MAKWTKVGKVCSNKDGKPGNYIKVEFARDREGKPVQTEITLKEGQIIRIQDPRKSTILTEDQKRKIPAFIKYELLLPPSETDQGNSV